MFTKKEWHYGGSGGVELNGKRAYFPEVDEELLRSKIGMYISRIQIFSSRVCDLEDVTIVLLPKAPHSLRNSSMTLCRL